MQHVVLLGDSIFDNGAYVRAGEPDVVEQLRERLPPSSRATLLAVDGAFTAGVAAQMGKLPADATHLVVSVGGNDALKRQDVLDVQVGSVAEALLNLARVRDAFARDYREMLDVVLKHGLPAVVSTIHDPRFSDPVQQTVSVAALTLFNDVITRAAFGRGLSLIDLRLICDEDQDYANPIEPGVHGGAKIAAAIGQLIDAPNARRFRSTVAAGGHG